MKNARATEMTPSAERLINSTKFVRQAQEAGQRADELFTCCRPSRPADAGENPQPYSLKSATQLGEAKLPSDSGSEKAKAGFRLLTAAEMTEKPPLSWRVPRVLPRRGVGAIYGPPSAGKSFLVLDLLAAISAGRSWFGYKVKPCPVLYIGLEGEAGISQRLRAFRAKHGQLGDIRFLSQPLDLRKKEDRSALIRTIKAEGLTSGILCIDTLAASAPGMDENSSSDMGEIIAALKAIQVQLDGFVLAVHHTGKNPDKGMRGHSSLLGALDCSIEVTRGESCRQWRVAKAKDGADDKSHAFRLDTVNLGKDEDGELVTSCIVAPSERPAESVKKAKVPSGGNQRLVYEALVELMPEFGISGVTDTPPGRKAIELEDAIRRIRGRLACEPKRKTERCRGAITSLANRGLIMLREDWLWIP